MSRASLKPRKSLAKSSVLSGASKLFSAASELLGKAQTATERLGEAHRLVRQLEASGAVKSPELQRVLGSADKVLAHAERAGKIAGKAQEAIGTAESVARALLERKRKRE